MRRSKLDCVCGFCEVSWWRRLVSFIVEFESALGHSGGDDVKSLMRSPPPYSSEKGLCVLKFGW